MPWMRGYVPLADIGVELIGVVGNRVARMLRDPAGLEEVESERAPKARPNINTTFSYGCSKARTSSTEFYSEAHAWILPQGI
jgi:hypothetical protein